MTAIIECGVCGTKIYFDSMYPIRPEDEGWKEVYLPEVSIAALMEGRRYKSPVCPKCLDFYAQLMSNYDYFSG